MTAPENSTQKGMRRFLVVLVITAALAALFLFGLTPRDPRDVASPHLNKPMEDFEAPVIERYQDTYGETLRYSDYLGRPLIVNVWASWCIPACWNEAPRWKAAWEAHQDSVMIIGINFQDTVADANEFLDRFDKSFPSVRDPRGAVGISWGVLGVPETFFIRSDGTLSHKHNGEITTDVIEEQIKVLVE